jgi:protein SCO1/2
MRRREALGVLAAALPFSAAFAENEHWQDIDVTGTSPPLEFIMQSTPLGETVFQNNYVGYVTMLYFGYTFCPDVCPLTMQNVAAALAKTGAAAKDIRFLFVTVDPARDTIPVLRAYVSLFGPGFVGLRGDADQLELLAKRFRIAYSVTPSPDPSEYEVTHSSAIYLFDRQGNARLLVPSMASQQPDIDGLNANLVRLTNDQPSSWMAWLRSLV